VCEECVVDQQAGELLHVMLELGLELPERLLRRHLLLRAQSLVLQEVL